MKIYLMITIKSNGETVETSKTEQKISSLKESYEEPVKRKTDYEIVEEIINTWEKFLGR